MKIIKLNLGLICLVLLSIVFLSNESHINPINNQDRNESPISAQSQFNENEGSLTVSKNFSLIEISENTTALNNVKSVDINMGTSRWNVTNIKINITDMYFKNETKIIEDQFDAGTVISSSEILNLGVQIQIHVPTIIYGIQIYGINSTSDLSLFKKTYLQIQGSNKITQKPNGTIYSSVSLNMSKSNGLCWHMHRLNSALYLNKGVYYLVLNGTEIGNTPQIFYDWKYSYLNPYFPNLNISKYYKKPTPAWSDPILGYPYLYKIDQRINQDFYPKEINMTAKINESYYPIQNGSKISTGNLTVSFKNFFPNTKILQIPVKCNISNALFFNSSYYVKLNNSLISSGSVEIKDGIENKWTIEPNLVRFGWNYTVSYKYPKTLKNLEVYRGITKLIENNDFTNSFNTIIVLNKTIPEELISWKITSNSTFFELTLPVTQPDEFEAGKDIGFIINNPKKGDYTLILIDTIGIKRYENSTTYSPPGNLNFNWTLPTTSISGEWSAYFFWNNLTDAGAETYKFTVSGGVILIESLIIPSTSDGGGNGKTEVTGLDPFVVFMIILIIGIVSASSFTSYATLKKVKKNRDIRRKKLFDKVTNILNLSHVIVIDKNSGLNVYQEFYGGRDVDTTLVSGFLDAIRSFGIELTSARTQSQTISLEYQESKILMAEFKSFRLIFIMGEKASEEFLKSITNLSYDIDNYFGEELRNFKGDVVKFREIRNLIEKNLNTAFVYPLNVFEPKDVKLNPSERAMILKAKKFMKENNLNYFFTSFLLSEQNINPKDIEIIFKLVEKKIFQPIELTSNIK